MTCGQLILYFFAGIGIFLVIDALIDTIKDVLS